MERLYITHYYYPGTDPWKNIMLLPEDEAFRVAVNWQRPIRKQRVSGVSQISEITILQEKEQMSMCGPDLLHWAENLFWHILIHLR